MAGLMYGWLLVLTLINLLLANDIVWFVITQGWAELLRCQLSRLRVRMEAS